MKLTIAHETHYRFEQPANHSIQYLRLVPRNDSSQETIAWQVSTPGRVKRWIDGFGNTVYISVQNGRHDEVPVVVRGEIETIETHGVLPADDGLPPQMFLRATRYTAMDDAIVALAEPYRERLQDEGIIAALHGVMYALHTTVEHRSGVTDVDSTAAEALTHGFGVCQDHAHLFIACCRHLEVPARYVSGYLFARSGERGTLASHAWAEAYVAELGWVSFDPTNCQSATDAYVRLAIGFDYATAAPIRGVRKGGGDEALTVTVKVGEAQ